MSHILLDRTFRDANPQLEQFSANALGSPQAIVQRHRFNQSDRFSRQLGGPRGSLRSLPPVPAEKVAMPFQEGIGLDNQKRLFPPMDSTCEQHQEHSISLGASRALHLTAEDNELLT